MTDFASSVRYDILPYINGEGLDIGCGDNRPWDWLVGVDNTPGTTPRGPNQIRDARKLVGYFADESQDFIFSSHLLNEMDDWETLLAGWWRLLKPNGYLILFLPIQGLEGPQPPEMKRCGPRLVVDAMLPLKPWQMVDARVNGERFFQVYRKCDGETIEQPDPDKVCAVLKLGAHGDAIWASSVFPGLKEQGFYTMLWCQETTEEVLRHDPNIDRIVRFSSNVPMGELGGLFTWLEHKYKNCRILVETVEGTLLPSPQKIQYHFPLAMRHKLMDFNYLEMHAMKAEIPFHPEHNKFYPNYDEMAWANDLRKTLTPYLVVLVPNGSSVTKFWPYAGELAKYLLRRNDVTVCVLGDLRGCEFEDHPRLMKVGTNWPIRKCMTFAQLANVVVGQETGIVNSVAFEADVRKVVLMTHSSHENLTRDWPNTATMIGHTDCGACHRLHYDWTFCPQDKWTKAAACQTAISINKVLVEIDIAIPAEMAA